QLVPAALPVRLRNVPLRRGLARGLQPAAKQFPISGAAMATASLARVYLSEFAAEVRAALTRPVQRELPSKHLYDEVGTQLFETICVLPEYGLIRADARLLRNHAKEIVGMLPPRCHVAELGSGSGKKTRWILEALSRRGRTYYYPIEISPSALEACEKELGQI